MASNQHATTTSTLEITKDIVCAYLADGQRKVDDVQALIRNVFACVVELEGADAQLSQADSNSQPKVPVEDSIQKDYIVCLEDGKRLKMLKRYLKTNYNMTPEEYRKRWKLPSNYPMVAPNYAKKRSELAKSIGLGKQRAPKRMPALSKAASAGRGRSARHSKA